MKEDKQPKITNFEELLENKYGRKGEPAREAFDEASKAFMIGELIREARKEAKLTQAELAARIGTQKSYISRIESGKSDIQLSTLFKLIEEGLGKTLSLRIG